VNGFFIISGFLISWSIDRSFELRAYFIKRMARIYPLYAVVIIAQLLAMWHFNTELNSFAEAAKYTLANLASLNFIKPWFGTMVNEPINGSLWTIKVELMFYVAIPIYIWFLRRWGVPWLLFSFACAFAYRFGLEDYNIQLARQIPGSMTFFIAGSTGYFFGARLLDKLKQPRFTLLAAVLMTTLFIAASENYYAWRLLYVVALAVALYALAFYLPVLHLRYDISYGIYLWHVPIFLTLRHIEFYAAQPLQAFIYGSLIVALVALASAIFIEVPMIKWGSRRAKKILARSQHETNRTEL